MRRTILAAALALLTAASQADYSERPAVRDYIDSVVERHGFERSALITLFAETERRQRILDAISRPAERVKPWHEYRDIFVTRKRIEEGVDFWRENEAALNQAHEAFSVPPEFVVAIIGVETSYGRVTGSHRVMDALATLAFDYPPRSDFFTRELTQFLVLVTEEKKDPLAIKGSYAGAMGFGQFMPSSYRAYAVDFDDDGRRDIWNNVTDAVGSVANYFERHGWRAGDAVALQVEVDGDGAQAIANEGLAPNYDVAELKRLGVKVDAVADDAKAALFRMEAEDGEEYWLGLHNFYVITRYNRSAMYALAVMQLAEALRGAKAQVTGGPAPATRLNFGGVGP